MIFGKIFSHWILAVVCVLDRGFAIFGCNEFISGVVAVVAVVVVLAAVNAAVIAAANIWSNEYFTFQTV